MRAKSRVAVVALALAAGTSTIAIGADAASAAWTGPCWQSSSGFYWCYNVTGPRVVYSWNATNTQLVAGHPMWSNPSWFYCRTDAAPGSPLYYPSGVHPGRWLWTVADDGTSGAMRDLDIYSETNTVSPCV